MKKLNDMIIKLDREQGNLLSFIDSLEIINENGELDEIIDQLQEANKLINDLLDETKGE
jgi:hypothetical protein